MIVANLRASYLPAILPVVDAGHTDPKQVRVADFSVLTEAASGDWYRMADTKLAEFGDILAGVHGDQVVGVWKILRWNQRPDGTVRFTLRPAPQWAPLIGHGAPDGPWRQGEARVTRYLDTAQWTSYRDEHSRIGAWKEAMWRVALAAHRRHDKHPARTVETMLPAETTIEWPGLGQVTLRWQLDRILVVEVPDDVRVRTVKATPTPPTLTELAKAWGVSVTTARRRLKTLTDPKETPA